MTDIKRAFSGFMTIRAKLLALIAFLVLILIFSGFFLQSAINENTSLIARQSRIIQTIRDTTAAGKAFGQLRYQYVFFLNKPTESTMAPLQERIDRFQESVRGLDEFSVDEVQELQRSLEKLDLLAEQILKASETEESSPLLISEAYTILTRVDEILAELNNSFEILLAEIAKRTLSQTEHMHRIPILFLVGGIFTVLFAVLLVISNIFLPVGRITRAMAAAAIDTEHADNYILPHPRREDEIGKVTKELNHLLHEVAANIALNREAEAKLRETGRYMQAIMDSVVDGLIIVDNDGTIESFSPSAEKIFGYRSGDIIGHKFERILRRPGTSDSDITALTLNYQSGKPPREYEAVRSDGRPVPVELTIGEADYANRHLYIATVRDISSRKQMESFIEQAQRMDTVGRMTGGIAHDFNNMLTVIAGNLEILERRVKDDDTLRELVLTALESVDRGTDLTQRLLAFSRKQILQPHMICINKRLPAIQEMMRRAVREDISISTRLEPDLWECRIDPMQLENALINLAINARDAIPGSGRIVVETANIVVNSESGGMTGADSTTGDYVMVSVADDGTGIKREILDKVFDPFFTTKDVGKGTGLGLSMVYGFTHQSGGFITVESEPGEGTTVKLFFPKASDVRDADRISVEPEMESQAKAEEPPQGKESVLVVEDEPDVLQFLTNSLRELGYKVTQARDGASALSRLARRKNLDLLLTDVVMPGGINGEELSRQVHERFPNVKTLFISGYTKDALVDQGNIKEGFSLLSKPFTRTKLAHKVREVLDD